MRLWRRIVNTSLVLRCVVCLFLCSQIALSACLAWAARPIPSPPIAVPQLTRNEAAPQPTKPYPGAPVVRSVSPDYGPRHGWTLVEITGENFDRGLKVLIGGREAFDLERISNTRIRARTPENTFVGSADVIVRNPDGKAGGLLNGYLYEGAIFEVPGYNVPPDWHWATCIRLADMDGDGKKDFLIAKPWRPLDDEDLGNLLIYLQGPDRTGDGVPNFERVTRNKVLNDTKNHYTSLEVADLTGNGHLDFVAVGRVEWYQFVQRNQVNRVFLNDGKLNFTVKDLPGNQASSAVDIGDVNGDGHPDLVIATLGGQSQLLFGDGKGNFRDVTKTHFPQASLWTTHIHLVDVNGDGHLDAVVANAAPPKQERGAPNLLYINDGKGRFADRTAEMGFPSGDQHTYRVASADVDRDGDMDLVLANRGASLLLTNDGRGRFRVEAMPPYHVKDPGGGPGRDVSRGRNFDVQVSDINGDGYPDLAFCSGAASLMMYINVPGKAGQRAFEARPDLVQPRPAGHGSQSIFLADVDGDGKPDLTIASGHEQTPLWINQWPKGFRFATADVRHNLPYTDWVAWSCAIGDMTGDGRPDIAMGQRHESDLLLFLQGKDGWTLEHFSDPSVLTQGKSVVESIGLADVDGDGDPDLILGLRAEPSVLLLNQGKAKFTAAKGRQALPQTPIGTSKILPVDVNRNGHTDLVMCNWDRRLLPARRQMNSLFINQGKGVFRDASNEFLPQVRSTARGGDVGDINRNGYPDIVLACMTSTLIGGPMPNQLYLNRGKDAPGQFVDASHLLPPNNARSTDAALVDVDGDGLLDIVFTNEPDHRSGLQGEDHLFRQRKDGTFEDWSHRIPQVSRLTWQVRILDFNLDRAPDIFYVRSYWNYSLGFGPKAEHGRLLLNVNDGEGNFSFPAIRQMHYIDKEYDSWTGSCVGDLDGDGYDEIVECVDGQVRIFKTFLRTKAVARPVYAEVPVGQSIRFDASATHFAYGLKAASFAWQFGDGNTARGQTVSHAYAKRGTYTVTLKVTDNAKHTDTDRVTVVVK